MFQSPPFFQARVGLRVPSAVRLVALVAVACLLVIYTCWLTVNRSPALVAAPIALAMLAVLAWRPYAGAVMLLLYSTVHFFVVRVIFQMGDSPSLLINTWKDWFLLLICAVWIYQRRGRGFSAVPGWLIAALVTYSAITFVQAFNPLGFGFRAAFTDFRWTTLSIIFALIIADTLRSAKTLRVTLALLLGMGVFQAIYGIYQKTVTFQRAVALGADPGYGGSFILGHLKSFGAVGGQFGPYLAMLLPFAVAWLMTTPRWWQRLPALAICMVLLIAIVDASTRVAWVMAAVGIVAMCVVTRRWLFLALAVVASLVFVATASGYTAYRLHAVLDPLGQSSTFKGRTVAWAGNYQLVLQDPFGFGLGTTGDSRYRAGVVAAADNVPAFLENEWLDLGLEIGLPGIVAFAWVLGGVVLASIRARRDVTDPWLRVVWAAAFSIVIMCIIAGLDARTVTASAPISWYFWASVGLLFALPHIQVVESALPVKIHSGDAGHAT
ncbi:MAG: O-antigen ligase family protein [Chloroflexi bacterium]|nr:O-antigen ligase family protein [Chloroflexota bacterium]